VAKTVKPNKKDSSPGERVVAQNRSASYNYHLLEKMEAGMVLKGTEVKSLRDGKAMLRDAYAIVRGNAVWLVNCHIPEYLAGGPFNHEPLRARKLLLNKLEIDKLAGKTDQKGLTIIPLRIYFRGGRAKCELALAKGKKMWDRRQAERDKETRRETEEALHRYRRR
jgi:SsrA-binding protein